jgi:flavodoxin
MIKKFLFFGALLTLFGFNVSAQETASDTDSGKKILIAYYTVSGNTQQVAEAIQKDTDGDLYQIETIDAYPTIKKELLSQAKREISVGYRPELKTPLPDIDQYDIIFVGSPCWWGTITPAVSTFISDPRLAGKTVVPFITHSGGGEQNTLSDFKRQCEYCMVQNSAWIGYGNRTFGLADWLKDLGFNK